LAICINREWLPYVVGLLEPVALADYWIDAAHKDSIDLLIDAMNQVAEGCVMSLPQTILRAEPADCGVQWSLDNGDTWNTIDLTDCITLIADTAIAAGLQSGLIAAGPKDNTPGAPPEPPACIDLNINMDASEHYAFPYRLNSGDTITVSDEVGNWTDGKLGIFSAYYCIDGRDFVLGACLGARIPLASDPDQSANHMELLLNVNGTYYEPLRGTVTIPEGVFNAPAVFMPNYDYTPDGQGHAQFKVHYCPTEATWCYEFDFTLSEQGWIVKTCGSSLIIGEYVENEGFRGTYHAGYYTGEFMKSMPENLIWDEIELDVFNSDTTDGGALFTDELPEGGGCTTVQQIVVHPGESTVHFTRSSIGDYTNFYVAVFTGDAGGTVTLRRIRFRGNGATPNMFGESNCV
jgi:hypothetical protein